MGEDSSINPIIQSDWLPVRGKTTRGSFVGSHDRSLLLNVWLGERKKRFEESRKPRMPGIRTKKSTRNRILSRSKIPDRHDLLPF